MNAVLEKDSCSGSSGADPGGGHGGQGGTEQVLNVEVYRALSTHSYSDTAHISI